MRKITEIIVHCSATREGQPFTVKDIDRWHRARKWNGCGYHYVITLDGQIQEGRKIEVPGAHVAGHNANSIGICYIGGLDKDGKAKDTRTDQQKAALYRLLKSCKKLYPDAEIKGHRDCSPDINGDGKIERWEWLKECPCFDVKKEYDF